MEACDGSIRPAGRALYGTLGSSCADAPAEISENGPAPKCETEPEWRLEKECQPRLATRIWARCQDDGREDQVRANQEKHHRRPCACAATPRTRLNVQTITKPSTKAERNAKKHLGREDVRIAARQPECELHQKPDRPTNDQEEHDCLRFHHQRMV